MKREDLKPDTDYATDLGQRVKVIGPDEIGWEIIAGDWVQAESHAQRFVKGKGYVPYQNNVTIRAVESETGAKMVIEPRHLLSDWEAYVAKAREDARRAEIREQNGSALEARATAAGLQVLVDPRKQEVRVPFDAFDNLLRLAKA